MRKTALLLAILFLAAISACGGDAPAVIEQTNAFHQDFGSMEKVEEFQNAAGEPVRIYTDGKYNYSVGENRGEAFLVSASPSTMTDIEEAYGRDPDAVIPQGDADQRMREILLAYFPEYDTAQLRVECNETRNHLDWFSYLIQEYDGINRVNIAAVSLAFDGTCTLVTGTHNSPEIFAGSDRFSVEEIRGIVFEYVTLNKTEIQREYLTPGRDTDGPFYDGQGKEMPPFAFLMETPEDMLDVEIVKLIKGDKPCWEMSFAVHDTWEQADPFFSGILPWITVYVDAMTGEVLSYTTTDHSLSQ